MRIKSNSIIKTALFLFMGVVIANTGFAQTKDIKHDEKTLKNTIADKKEDRHEVGKDLAHLKVKKAMKERKEVRHHRRSIHHQAKHLNNHGVKHPIEKAKHQVKAEKEAKKGKE